MRKSGKGIFILLPVLLLWIMTGCSSLRQVRPLELGEHKVSLDLGGALFDNLGIPLPMPLVSVDYQYGLTRDITVGGAVHITPIIFGLIGMIELNSLYGVLYQKGAVPGVSLHLNALLMYDFAGSFTALPELGAVAYWDLSQKVRVYTGVSTLVDFYPKTADLPKDNTLIPSIIIGSEFIFDRFDITVEVRYVHPGGSNTGKAVSFVGLGDQGAIAPYLGFSYRFGGAK